LMVIFWVLGVRFWVLAVMAVKSPRFWAWLVTYSAISFN
jgi:hypothetical protein